VLAYGDKKKTLSIKEIINLGNMAHLLEQEVQITVFS
jgi:hypothetical protein